MSPGCSTTNSRGPISSPPPSATEPAGAASEPPAHRFGYIALVGRPNAGKSTLFNTFLGQRLSIVTARPQTTRGRILGILTRPTSQVVLLDTPGLLEPSYKLHETMERQIERACADADAVVLLLDATRPDDRSDLVRAFLERNRRPLLAVLNKVDCVEPDRLDGLMQLTGRRFGLESLLPLSALQGINVPRLLADLEGLIPAGPPLYPEEMVADQPERFFAAELIRETAFEQLSDELPYSIQVEIDEFREPEDDGRKTYIHATLYVERDSQKGIVIGKRGSRLRTIGSGARRKIEELIDDGVFLELRVRVRPDWRKRDRDLNEFGYV
jgi:GTP-binding protein Era